jgi:hypothetical protein
MPDPSAPPPSFPPLSAPPPSAPPPSSPPPAPAPATLPRLPPAPSLVPLAALAAAGAVASVLAAIAVSDPARAERLCADGGLAATLSLSLSRATSPLPFSLAEVLLALGAATLLTRAARAALALARRRTPVLRTLLAGALLVLAPLSLSLASYFPLFGAAYARPPLAERIGLAGAGAVVTSTAEELAGLAEQLVDEANMRYAEATGVTDTGRPSEPAGPAALDAALEAAYARVGARLGLGASFGAPRGPAKSFAVSRAMTVLGLGGFYFPWTGEANVNAEEPWCARALTIAHEKAHQRLIALEDEASFAGWLACASSDDPYARYSGALFAQRQLLVGLALADAERARALVARRHRGVQRDVDDLRAWVRRHDTAVSQAAHAVNDAYLKANAVREGALSYSGSARLILLWARARGGALGG